jgi:hypothetical protein
VNGLLTEQSKRREIWLLPPHQSIPNTMEKTKEITNLSDTQKSLARKARNCSSCCVSVQRKSVTDREFWEIDKPEEIWRKMEEKVNIQIRNSRESFLWTGTHWTVESNIKN